MVQKFSFAETLFSEAKFREIVRYFVADLSATQIATLSGISRNSINKYVMEIRHRIYDFCNSESPFIALGDVELDESYFDARRVRGKRGRGAYGKTIVFGLLKRGGKVYTEIVPDCKSKTLQDIVRGKVSAESVIHTDGWRGYDGLVDIGYDKHFRVNHGNNELANKQTHINGIESFWSFAKTRLVKFHGITKST
ncbi:MAG: IS1595 family transposase, partial [Neisseriaceae bacterium]